MIGAMSKPLTLERFYSTPRLSGLRLAPDGSRLVVAVTRPGPEANQYRTALWQVDPADKVAPRRLTRSAAGESQAAFASDGSIVFTSARPDPDAKADPDNKIMALWSLPAGGEARLLLAPDGGVEGVAAARDAAALALGIPLHPEAADLDDDAKRTKARKDAKVGAILFEDYPIRYWDHWLGPQRQRIFAAPMPPGEEAKLKPRDVTGDAGPAFLEADFDISPDGRTIVTSWGDWSKPPATLQDLVLLDVESKTRRKLTAGDAYYFHPRFSPDGRFVAAIRATFGTPKEAAVPDLWLLDLATGQGRSLSPGKSLWPESLVWAHDSSAVFFTAARLGWQAAFRADLTGELTVLVSEGSLSDLCPSPDGKTVYALRATMSTPARIVRFSARGENQTPVELRKRINDRGTAGNGRVERLVTRAGDGQEIGSWLVLPPDASAGNPAPLVVGVHGGPLGSWNGWHWRWNPHLFAERGYAVLLPDPAISLGYGQHMLQRGWGRWGETPYTDIIAATDAALKRPDLDAKRTALAGGSFGGYMANWVAGHTDRFKAIVTHASLWDLRPFHGTTDGGVDWEHEMGDPYTQPELYDGQSPAGHVGKIKTPILVIHGERDFRVPLSEGLTLWTDLMRHGVAARFLYYPDENHWILKPRNARLWYETVLAFLDEHVLGKEWVRPELL
jgi:dipeptidyl aminopeptidase/acylaminoacyl peptidase